MRVLLFGAGSEITRSCLEALEGAGHDLVFITRELSAKVKLRRAFGRRSSSERFARRAGIPVVRYANAAKSREMVAALKPDIICIATFTLLIPPSIAALAPYGAINLHPSLLPRHRGPQTMFQIYHDGDRDTGITVHRATASFDAGPIIVQERFDLPRGMPVEALGEEIVRRAGPLMARAVAMVAAGAPEQPQDEALATRSRRFDPTFSAPLAEWDVEQSWHFLSGYCATWQQKLFDRQGKPVRYRGVGEYRRTLETLPPGTVEADGDDWLLHCKGGVIRLER